VGEIMQAAVIKWMLMLLMVTSQVSNTPEPPPINPEVEWVESIMRELTLPEKIGQLIVTGVDSTTLADDESLMIRNNQVGGIIFLGHNIKSDQQLRLLQNEIRSVSDIPLFLAIDQEGGRVQRLPLDKSQFPSALQIGKTNEKVYEYGSKLGMAVKSFELNVNFAPVLDIFSNPRNKVIGNRAFGNDPESVARIGTLVMKGIQDQGVIACVKHFPGHGDTSVDSHVGLPVIQHNIERLKNYEWIPFQEAIDSGAEMVMTAHILLPNIDPDYPATMSEEVITGVLRNDMGFDGVVITDDLVMGAISKQYSYEEASLSSFKAGVDLLLISNNNYVDEIQHALYSAVKRGELEESRVDESVKRILSLKYKYLK